MNKILYLTSTEVERDSHDEDGNPIKVKAYEFENNITYPIGTLIYDTTRKCLLISDGSSSLNALEPIGINSNSSEPATLLGIPEEEFGNGELI